MFRLNLPENSVASSYMSPPKQGIMGELKDKLLYSNVVADWVYRDFIFVKFACSERMKTELIGLPFKQWKKYNDNVSSCEIENLTKP
jgi:hypothetical protein